MYLYNSSHELSPYIQRVVLHHVEGHCTHDQYVLLVMQVHTAAGDKRRVSETKFELNRTVLVFVEGHQLVAKSCTAQLVMQTQRPLSCCAVYTHFR